MPLPQPVLEMLRQYWGTHRDPVRIFPSAHQTVKGHASPTTTAIYTHLTKPSEDLAIQAVNRIVAGQIGFLGIQFMHTRSQECGLGMAVCLKFQIVRLLS